MNILLINENPVVSRLLVLCARDGHITLEEVESIGEIKHEYYDVVFIDEGSYEGEVLSLSDNVSIGKKILLSNADVEISDFDMTIKKPFLPSQIIEVLESIEVNDETADKKKNRVSIFPLSADSQKKVADADEDLLSDTQVLDSDELEKIKSLLEMDDEIEMTHEELSEEEIQKRKVEAIKEQLKAEGLEIVGEEDIVDELSSEDEIIIFSNDDKDKVGKKNKKKSRKDEKKKTKKNKELDFTKEELERIEDAVQVAVATLKRKQMKKLLKGKEVEMRIKLEDNG